MIFAGLRFALVLDRDVVRTMKKLILAGGGFEHGTFKDVPMDHHKVPLCNLYLSVLNRFGVESERFGTSTGTFI